MKILFSMGGGFAYLPRRNVAAELDVDTMDGDQSSRLRSCIAEAGFFDLPERIGGDAGARDADYYILTVEDEARRHTVRAEVPVTDPALWELICVIRQCVPA